MIIKEIILNVISVTDIGLLHCSKIMRWQKLFRKLKKRLKLFLRIHIIG